MKKLLSVLSAILLAGCANQGGSIYDTLTDLHESTASSLRSILGVPNTYTAPTLASAPTPSGCYTPQCVELDRIEAEGYTLARTGRSTWVRLVDRFYQRRAELYPDSQDQYGVSELRAYQRVLAEQMDMKKLTESQWVYLIEKKNSEISARNAALSNSAPRTQNCTTTKWGNEYRTTCN